MGDARASEDRLPWLDSAPARASTPAAPRQRTPLLLLLALFLAAGLAVIAFLAGRTTAPRAVPPPPVRIALPAPAALPVAPAAPQPPAAAEPAPVAAPEPARRAIAPRAAPRRAAVRRPARADRRGMVPPITRAFPRAKPAAARLRAATRAAPASGATAGIVQLGAYVTTPLLEASWARLVGAYPRLATLPRAVTATAPAPGRPRYWRLRVLTASPREARALCDHLHRIGRGCMVVRGAK